LTFANGPDPTEINPFRSAPTLYSQIATGCSGAILANPWRAARIEGAPGRRTPRTDPASCASAKATAIDLDQEQAEVVRLSHGKWLGNAPALGAQGSFEQVSPSGPSQINPRATKTNISARNAVLRVATARKASTGDRCMARLADLRSPTKKFTDAKFVSVPTEKPERKHGCSQAGPNSSLKPFGGCSVGLWGRWEEPSP
jgi:hypothetical protein